jgi:hypothetical protein
VSTDGTSTFIASPSSGKQHEGRGQHRGVQPPVFQPFERLAGLQARAVQQEQHRDGDLGRGLDRMAGLAACR